MTVIAIRDGVMAVDSRVASGVVEGEVKKWTAVPEEYGGGFIATSGDIGPAISALQEFATNGSLLSTGEFSAFHLMASGEVRYGNKGLWVAYDAPFYAAGSGVHLALAAMMAGADAGQAVEIACDLMPSDCGGAIHVLRIGG